MGISLETPMYSKFTNEMRLICDLLKEENGKKDFNGIKEKLTKNRINWDMFLAASEFHEISEILYSIFERNSLLTMNIVPKNIIDKLEKRFYGTCIRNARLWNEYKVLNSKLKNAEIEHIPLKGIILSSFLYPDSGARRMADIDILIKKEDIFKINKLLIKEGYRTKHQKDLKYAIEKKESFLEFSRLDKESGVKFDVDLQWTDEVDAGDPNKIVLTDAFQRRNKIMIEDIDIFMLSPEDIFFNLCLHQRRFGKTIILKYLYDMVLLLKKYESGINWDFVVEKCKKNKLNSLVSITLHFASSLLGAPCSRIISKNYDMRPFKNKILFYFYCNRMFRNNKRPRTSEEIGITYILFLFLVYNNFNEVIRNIFQKKKFAKFYRLKYPSFKTSVYFIFAPFYIFLIFLINHIKINKFRV